MTEQEMRTKIAAVVNHLTAERDKAQTKVDEQFAEVLIAGVQLLGELFIDVKRIADAAQSR